MARRSRIVLLLAMIIVATQACNTAPSADEGPTNCGTDMDCFIAAAANCQPSTVAYRMIVDFLGIIIDSTMALQIEGTEGQDCVVHLRTERVSIAYSEEIAQELQGTGMSIQDIEDQTRQMEGEAMEMGYDDTCRGSASDLVDLLERWQEGTYSDDDWEPFSCQGNLFGP